MILWSFPGCGIFENSNSLTSVERDWEAVAKTGRGRRNINRGGSFQLAITELERGVWLEGVMKKMFLAPKGGQRHMVRGLRLEEGSVEALCEMFPLKLGRVKGIAEGGSVKLLEPILVSDMEDGFPRRLN